MDRRAKSGHKVHRVIIMTSDDAELEIEPALNLSRIKKLKEHCSISVLSQRSLGHHPLLQNLPAKHRTSLNKTSRVSPHRHLLAEMIVAQEQAPFRVQAGSKVVIKN